MLRRFLHFFRPNRLEDDMREELEFHRAQAGTTINPLLIRDSMRDASTIQWLETTWQDLRYAMRQLRKAPVLVTIALLSLALGIGANTAIFSLINTLLLQALPVHEPDRLVLFNDDVSAGEFRGGDPPNVEFSYPFFQYLQSHNDSFESLCAFRQGDDSVVMHVEGTPDSRQEPAAVHLVSWNYFETLGVNIALGRFFKDSDDTLAASPTAVLSYAFWKGRFDLDPSVLGRTVVLNGVPFTVIGVADSSFFGERVRSAPSFWLPLSKQPQIMRREAWSNWRADWIAASDMYWLNFMGRLKPHVSRETAQLAVNFRLHQYYLDQAGSQASPAARRKINDTNVELKPGGSGISFMHYLYAKPLHILMAVVTLVLLIACSNIATLLLARASARRPEFLARRALGASRMRLFRQVLTESVLLSVLGGIFGAAFTWWSVRLLMIPINVPSVLNVKPDPVILAFAFAISVISGILFGIAPAMMLSRMDIRPGGAMRAGKLGFLRLNAQRMLIAPQVALSLALLIGAALLVHSLLVLERQNLGFTRDNILIVRTNPSLVGYASDKLPVLYRELDERLNAIPGVLSASIARFSPESGHSSSYRFDLEGYNPGPAQVMKVSDLQVGPHFFETFRMPVLYGRPIDARDTPTSPTVVVVNESFVRQYSPDRSAIGRRISINKSKYEIVGVAADSKYHNLRERDEPMAFFSIWQKPVPEFELMLHTVGNPEGVATAVRGLLEASGKLPAMEVTSLDLRVEKSLRQEKMITSLCSVFGAVALLLASIGIYGTLAYSVTDRTREIGIRMAIGARRPQVTWLVLRDSFILVLAGICIGIPIALASTRWIRSFLYGVTSVDPIAIAAAVFLILALASFAAYFPAARAAGVDPMRALRHE